MSSAAMVLLGMQNRYNTQVDLFLIGWLANPKCTEKAQYCTIVEKDLFMYTWQTAAAFLIYLLGVGYLIQTFPTETLMSTTWAKTAFLPCSAPLHPGQPLFIVVCIQAYWYICALKYLQLVLMNIYKC